MTLNADRVTVIGQCPTEMTYDTDALRFTVRCSLDAGHGGRHRGSAVIEFAPLVVVP